MEENKRRPEYNFDADNEYKSYKAIGARNCDLEKYSDWRDKIVEKYQGRSDKDILNFIKYLNNRLRCVQRRKELASVLFVPLLVLFITLALAIPSATISAMQYYDTIQSDIDVVDNQELESMQLRRRVEVFIKTTDFALYAIGVLLVTVIFYAVLTGIFINWCNKRYYFYLDYIDVISDLRIKKITLKSFRFSSTC